MAFVNYAVLKQRHFFTSVPKCFYHCYNDFIFWYFIVSGATLIFFKWLIGICKAKTLELNAIIADFEKEHHVNQN